MSRILPFAFLFSFVSLFSLLWIVFDVNPDSASTLTFFIFILSLFFCVWGFLGLFLYFVRTRFYRRYDPNWYFLTSFKMAGFVALFCAVSAILGLLALVTTLNVFLAIFALVLFAVWSYLGKKGGGKG